MIISRQKAIGINNTKIRGLYIVKYIALSVIGSVIGFFAGIPFGNMMLESISQEMVIGSESSYFVNILCSLGVVAVITLFCFSCTAKIKKYSPIDAVRSGETGERFHKKGILRIGKSRLDTVSFLAANDVLSSPKRYAIIMLAFTLCLSLVIIIANTANTLKSGQLINYLGMVESDVYYSDDGKLMECISAEGEKKMEDLLAKTEKELADNDMPAHCSCEIFFKVNVGYKDNICKISAYKGYGTTADEYVYIEGSAPQNADEIAMTEITADKLGAKIGDSVTINWHRGKKKYIISALYTSLNNLGEGIRLNENADADFVNTQGTMAAQIDFNDNPNSEEIQKRIEKLKDILNCDKIRTSSEYISEIIRVSETLDSVKMLVIVISMIIALLVTALIERSFIEKEKGEIAMLKAIGFKNGTVIKRDTIRLMLASVISSVIAVLISTPLTKLVINPIMGMMGATNGVIYEIAPTEVFLLYPIMMIAATTLTAFLTSLYSAKIKAADASNIE